MAFALDLHARREDGPVIIGAHSIVYSKNPDADREFLKGVLGLPHVDAGHGWLIFGLPPAEVAVHPSDENGAHELYLMTDDVEALIASLQARGLEVAPVSNQRWGLLTSVTLPGGGKLGIYEPRHARPPVTTARRVPKKKAISRKRASAARKRPGKSKRQRRPPARNRE